GHYDEAIEAFRKTLEIDPRFDDIYYNLGIAYERKGMPAEAVDAYLTSWQKEGQEHIAAYRAAFAQSGMPGFWRKHLEFLLQYSTSESAPISTSPFFVAAVQARLSEKDAAVRNLEK